jgi:cathepsin L
MKFVLFVGLLVGLAAAFTETEYQSAFVSWSQKYERMYTSEKFSEAFVAFKLNMDFVDEFMSGDHTFEVELNQFADITNEEYQRIYLGTRVTVNYPELAFASVYAPVDAVDWRNKSAVTPIKDQGQCGSCWSFSATGSIEAAHALKTGNLVSLSEQNLMDCSKSQGNQGCEGGLMDSAFKYVIANGGLDTEASYPYTAMDGTVCKYVAANSGATISKYTDVAAGSEPDLLKAVTLAPVSIAIDASQNSFQLYKSGVYTDPACSSTRLDHGVLAIGYGADGASDYWIVKNSWGTSWGLAGYIHMARNTKNMCGVATMASYPTV